MTIKRVVVAFPASLVVVSLVLSLVHHPYWLWLTAFVGANLLQSAFTGFCPLAKILKALEAVSRSFDDSILAIFAKSSWQR